MFIRKVKVCRKEYYRSEFVHAEAVGFFLENAVDSFAPDLERVARLQRYGKEGRFHIGELVVKRHGFAMAEIKNRAAC